MKLVKAPKKEAKSKSLVSIKKKSKPTKIVKSKAKVLAESAVNTGAIKSSKKSKHANKVKQSTGKKEKIKSHKEDLEGLKDLDPEFYDFLKKNDKELLEFDLFNSGDSDNEDDEKQTKLMSKSKPKSNLKSKIDEDDNDDDDDDNDNNDDEYEVDEDNNDSNESIDDDDQCHKPIPNLEVASDESDYEDDVGDDSTKDGSKKITLNLLSDWQKELLKAKPSIQVIRSIIQAFNSALASISADDNEKEAVTQFKVVGGAVFNGVVQLCVLHLQPALLKLLGYKTGSSLPIHKCKKWNQVRSCLRYYFTDLIKLIEQVSSTNILSVLLKHLHQMSEMVAAFSSLGKNVLKRLIVIWSTADETLRVLAFLCILKITRKQQVSMLNHVLKAMYLSYVRNSKFLSPNTLPGINFMRRSLVEMFALDLNVSYQHAFLYIRQLAIHLRNAVILKKKDSYQAVYNWQYINSIRLWVDLLSVTANKPQLQPLIYPLVTIVIGVIRLVPTAQYFPVRFHCIQSLITLSKGTNVYMPLLPLITEVLRSDTFLKKHTAVSMRPLAFTCILRLNKTQLSENGFRDEVIEQLCSLSLEYLSHESCSLAFSDIVVPTVIALKSYLKNCRNANYTRKIKQLLDKIQVNAQFIDGERRKITFGLKDGDKVQAWEVQVRNKGTPLDIYYTSWMKTHELKKRRMAAQTHSINSDYDLPTIKRQQKGDNKSNKNENGDVELFPSDSEDDMEFPIKPEDNAEFDDCSEKEEAIVSKKNKLKEKKDKQQKKKSKVSAETEIEVDLPLEEPDDNVDIVKDLDLDDW